MFPGPSQPNSLGSSHNKPYSFTPPVGFSLSSSNEVTNVNFNNQSSGFRFETPSFSTTSPNTTTTTTTTSTSTTSTTTTTTSTAETNTTTTGHSEFLPEAGYDGLRTSLESNTPSQPQHRVSFVPSLPQRAEQEWVRTKEKCTIVLIGPCNLGKKFLINTILSTSYETKRAQPTLGRHRSANNLKSQTLNNNNINNNNNNNNVASSSSNPNNVSINIASTSFDFELIDSNNVVEQTPRPANQVFNCGIQSQLNSN